ncbi:MAG: hypothetical protein LBR88_10510 [Zoogloeaceae bacterium]|jgi:hypothetical protein|nr:hypothetical protein [Zoogloeaceae bacterium]
MNPKPFVYGRTRSRDYRWLLSPAAPIRDDFLARVLERYSDSGRLDASCPLFLSHASDALCVFAIFFKDVEARDERGRRLDFAVGFTCASGRKDFYRIFPALIEVLPNLVSYFMEKIRPGITSDQAPQFQLSTDFLKQVVAFRKRSLLHDVVSDLLDRSSDTYANFSHAEFGSIVGRNRQPEKCPRDPEERHVPGLAAEEEPGASSHMMYQINDFVEPKSGGVEVARETPALNTALHKKTYELLMVIVISVLFVVVLVLMEAGNHTEDVKVMPIPSQQADTITENKLSTGKKEEVKEEAKVECEQTLEIPCDDSANAVPLSVKPARLGNKDTETKLGEIVQGATK